MLNEREERRKLSIEWGNAVDEMRRGIRDSEGRKDGGGSGGDEARDENAPRPWWKIW